MGYLICAIGLLFGLVLFGTAFLIVHGLFLRLRQQHRNNLFYPVAFTAIILIISAFTPIWQVLSKTGGGALCLVTALASVAAVAINYSFRERNSGNRLFNVIFTLAGSFFLAIGFIGLMFAG